MTMALRQQRARELRKIGDQYFHCGDFNGALLSYNEASKLFPRDIGFWEMKVLCSLGLQDWPRVKESSMHLIILEKKSVLAHMYLGLALLHESESESESEQRCEGIKSLEKALELDKAVGGHFEDTIWMHLCAAKYNQWITESESGERRQLVNKLRDRFIPALRRGDLSACNEELLQGLEGLLEKAEAADKDNEPPEYLSCPITLSIMRDPVTTPNGVSYEKKAILEQISTSRKDPITKAALHASQLAPNLSLKNAVQHFLDSHAWAYKSYLNL